MNAKDLTYEQGYSDGYKAATDRHQKVIQELVNIQQMQLPPRYIVVTKMSKELELLKRIRYFDGNMSREQNQRYAELEEALNELEELKRNVARYFELANNVEITGEVLDEFSEIRDKLLKVGKEEQ